MIQTKINETLEGDYQVSFSIGNQMFYLESQDTEFKAIFFESQLKLAFSRFSVENISNAFYEEWTKSLNKMIDKRGFSAVPRFDIKKLSIRAAKKILK